MSLRAAILIISETASKDASTDKGIPALKEVFSQKGGDQWNTEDTRIVTDNVLDIQRAITEWTDGPEYVHLIVTSGGTGFAQKDVTPEAITPLIHKHASGLVHTMLTSSLAITPFASMARPVAGVRNKTLILTLPGSPKGAKENLEAVLKLLPHACQQAAGADSRTLHVGGVKKLEKDAGVSSTPQDTSVHQHHDHSHSHSHGHNHGHGHGHHHGPKAHTKPEDRPVTNDPSAGASRRYRESPYPMLPVNEALAQIAKHTPSPKVVQSPVNESIVGSVLAADVVAAESVPAFRASIVDGYAIVASSHPLVPSTKGLFPVVSISHAQAGKEIPTLHTGEVARITTGAPLPPGATAVVMVEDTILRSMTEDGKEEAEIEILTDAIKPGENVREPGSDVSSGTTILPANTLITAIGGEFGLLASVGTQYVSIYTRPVIGVLSTGDEIIPHDTFSRPLRLGEVRDTNRPTLLTAIRGQGYEAIDLGIASDQPGALEESLRSAMRSCDVIITSGGVSMGELDLLKPTIERQLGGTIHFGRVSMKPGKPTTFATVPFKSNTGERDSSTTKVIFSLPGNPASAIVTFHLFVLPALHKLSGISPPGLPKVSVILEQDVRPDPKRAEYHRVVVVAKADGKLYATSTGFQRSSAIGSFKGANALLCLPEVEGVLRKGETCEALLMGRIGSGGEGRL
ncbi:Putative molybdopterin biosynthesis protein MoeA [Septoria linicola]|uniref:Molybdopterin biosynthesis protein MoeA n=1 Tax=Septoria linicola TaxID=215465 RepID=A0A9Q9B4D0_9PEZI|nr:Putative molybdopterin biosynthesis protein MoeA [Septoria linicola]